MDALYAELRPDIEAVADPLFDISEQLLRSTGNFLPHGAVLTERDEVEVVATPASELSELVDSTEVLPILHAHLRQMAKDLPIKATGVAENVTITPEGQSSTPAIKVHVEHRRGLAVALYLPFTKRPLRGYDFGEMLCIEATPAIKAW